jgi:hypothetical protein
MYKNTLKIILLVAFIIIINGCSSWDTVETVTFREYKKIEQLRGQPPKIYVRASDSYVYIFSHSNYYIQNDTLFGKDNSGREIVLTNIKAITYNNYDIEQDVEVYYDPEKDSIVGYKYAGAKAYIEMNDGTDYSGELLVVRDSIMIVCEEYDADEQELADSVYALFVLNNRDIKLIELYVGNYLGIGIVVGGSMGSISGTIIGKTDEPKPPPRDPDEWDFDLLVLKVNEGAVTGFCLGGAIGAFIGGTIGYFITDDEVVYEYADPEEYDFKKLNIYSRYGDKEPEYLKKIK